MKRILRIVFIGCQKNPLRMFEDPSFIYRCENMAAALHNRGHHVHMTHISKVGLWERFDVAVFHRPRFDLRFYLLQAHLKGRGVQLIADFDDLIMMPELAQYSPGVMNGYVSMKKTIRMFLAHKKAIEYFDKVSVSTSHLARQIATNFRQIHLQVVPNAVHHSWRAKPFNNETAVDKVKQITYFSGTRSHDHDFAQISPVINQVMSEHQELKMTVMGPLKFQHAISDQQLRQLEKVPFPKYVEMVKQSWLNLAPLCDNVFNHCKSALKVMEAGYWGVPTLCSPFPDAARFLDSGALLCEHPHDWKSLIERCFLDKNFYSRTQYKLRERILQNADVYRISEIFLNLISKI
ncbi:MAG: glycosyltransferase [Oligoflexus sp.]